MAKTMQRISPLQIANAHSALEAMITRIERRPNCEIIYSKTNATTPTASLVTLRAPFGIEQIDRALDAENGSGIAVNALHEIRVKASLSAASGAGFALGLGLLLSRAKLQSDSKHGQADRMIQKPILPIFWISDTYTQTEYGNFYGLGLNFLGLRSEKLIRIHAHSKEDLLWAAGEIAATPNAAAFCLIEIQKHPKEINLTATRRLMLRAQTSGTPVILLRQSGEEEASAAATRWQVEPAPSRQKPEAAYDTASPLLHQFIGPPAFTVTLEKCRGGRANPSSKWTIEWNPHDQRFVSIETSNISKSTDSSFKKTRTGNQQKNVTRLTNRIN